MINIKEQMIKVNEAIENQKLATMILIKESQKLLKLIDTAEQRGINIKQLQNTKVKAQQIINNFQKHSN